MKVQISQRVVYHKYSEIEIEIDQDEYEQWKLANGEYDDLEDYLQEHVDLWEEKILNAHDNAELQVNSGIRNYDGLSDAEVDWELRYDCEELKTGGHL